MKYICSIVVAILLSVPAVYANDEKPQNRAERQSKVNVNVRAGVGAFIDVANADFGIAEKVSCLLDFPISKRYDGWKMNLGFQLSNKNISRMTFYSSMLMLEIPVIFSYDFTRSASDKLRLSFGLFYEQYLDGAIYVAGRKTGETPLYSDYLHPIHVGGTIGLGYYHKNFFMGLDIDMTQDWESFYLTPIATFGYRF